MAGTERTAVARIIKRRPGWIVMGLAEETGPCRSRQRRPHAAIEGADYHSPFMTVIVPELRMSAGSVEAVASCSYQSARVSMTSAPEPASSSVPSQGKRDCRSAVDVEWSAGAGVESWDVVC